MRWRSNASASSAIRSRLVVARDELTAFEALDLVDVEYEPLHTFADPIESLTRAEPAHPRLRRTAATCTRSCRWRFGDVEQRPRRGRPRLRGHVLLSGQHASADRAARGGRRARSRRQARAVVEHPDAALRPSRARQRAGHAGRAHPRHRHPERRRLRRQERSVQPRDRHCQGGAGPRPPGQDLPDPRGGVLLPPRTSSGADALQDRREARRHDHGRATRRPCSTAARTVRTASPARSTPARSRR